MRVCFLKRTAGVCIITYVIFCSYNNIALPLSVLAFVKCYLNEGFEMLTYITENDMFMLCNLELFVTWYYAKRCWSEAVSVRSNVIQLMSSFKILEKSNTEKFKSSSLYVLFPIQYISAIFMRFIYVSSFSVVRVCGVSHVFAL